MFKKSAAKKHTFQSAANLSIYKKFVLKQFLKNSSFKKYIFKVSSSENTISNFLPKNTFQNCSLKEYIFKNVFWKDIFPQMLSQKNGLS